MFQIAYYSVLAFFSFVELVILLTVFCRQKNTFYALLFISIFIANLGFLFESMSHEIRTPLNAVLGLNEMVLRETASETIRNYSVVFLRKHF